jgi:hypothetical protein
MHAHTHDPEQSRAECATLLVNTTKPHKKKTVWLISQKICHALSWIIQGSIHGMGKRFTFSPKHVDCIWNSPASYAMGTFPGVKQVECYADDTPPYSDKVNEWSSTSMPLHLSMAWTGSTLSFQ